jgi:hypothetical protein
MPAPERIEGLMSTVQTQGARPDARNHRSPDAVPGRVSFGSDVVLSKGEVFGACQALADADRALLRAGRTDEAGALGALFELLEQRLSDAA